MRYRHISVAVPALAEIGNLPDFIESLRRQSLSDFSIYICVNNPEGWDCDGDDSHRSMFIDNQKSIEYLHGIENELDLCMIDRSSAGHGWNGKQQGVGWARKTLFDCIASTHDDNELIVSLDADTAFNDTYLESVLSAMNSHQEHCALCVPYYHPLSGNDTDDRAMLRYEIYMRHYFISLSVSRNPYAFTALGSAMVFPLWAYHRVGGITPLQGGEDYYLMQKFAKTGKILQSCDSVVYPQGRVSHRVPFGTGPAIAKGIDAMDNSYPLYSHKGFDAVAKTYALFPRLFDEEIETPMSAFLRQQLKTDNIWTPLRKNFKSRELFTHACAERVDGLRILQFLKTFPTLSAEEELSVFCQQHNISLPPDFDFRQTGINNICSLRDVLFDHEMFLRDRNDHLCE